MRKPWTILSTHGLTLMCVARDPGMRLREIANSVGVTERTAFSAIGDLVQAGYLRRHKQGTRNRYEVNADAPFDHPLMKGSKVGKLLATFEHEGAGPDDSQGAQTGRRPIFPEQLPSRRATA